MGLRRKPIIQRRTTYLREMIDPSTGNATYQFLPTVDVVSPPVFSTSAAASSWFATNYSGAVTRTFNGHTLYNIP